MIRRIAEFIIIALVAIALWIADLLDADEHLWR